MKTHMARVMGVALDSKKNSVFSVSEDKKFKITELSYQEAHTGKDEPIKSVDMQVGTAPLKGLEYDAENQRVFILNDAGSVFIYTVAEKPPKLVKQVDTGSPSTLRGLSIDYARNYIFTCKQQWPIICRCSGRSDISDGDREAREGQVYEADSEYERPGEISLSMLAAI